MCRAIVVLSKGRFTFFFFFPKPLFLKPIKKKGIKRKEKRDRREEGVSRKKNYEPGLMKVGSQFFFSETPFSLLLLPRNPFFSPGFGEKQKN